MGQRFGKGVEADGDVDRSGGYEQTAPSTAWERDEGELFWTWRATQATASRTNSLANRESVEDADLFWTLGTKQDQDESCEGEEKEVDLFWTWRATRDEERPPVTDVTLVGVPAADEVSGQDVTPEIHENPETFTGDLEILTTQDPPACTQNPVLSDSHMDSGLDSNSDAVQNPVPSEADRDEEIHQTSFSQSEEKLEDDEKPDVIIQEINSCMYEIGEMLLEDSFVAIYEGIRVQDGLKVVVKYFDTTKRMDYIVVPGYPAPLPRQVGLHMLACQGDDVPEIVRLVDWQESPDQFVMVLERPSPCEGLDEFVASKGGELDELSAKDIMWQATMAAHMCCKRGVFQRDIKLENFVVTADTLDLKLVDFGCGELLQKSAYKTFTGTRDYACPEFFLTGEYYGKPATVYSLGVLLFTMLCGKFPNCTDRNWINDKIWYKDGLTLECCRLVQDCLQDDPDKRIRLEKIFKHKWFQDKDPADGLQTPVPSEHLNVLQYRDEAGFHINDDVDVLIFHTSNDQCEEEMEMEEMEEMEEKKPGVFIQEINLSQYEIGRQLGEGGFGTVFEGTRLQDGLKVAVKFVRKAPYKIQDHIDVPGYPEPIPREVYLQTLACEGKYVPVLIQFLGWQDLLDHYIMVLERPSPCEDLLSFLSHAGGRLNEQIVRVIMGQAIEAAEVCCMRGVFHRDIKLENFLINPNTLEVKLIDFGCGDLLKSSAYTDFMGTENYFCPEFFLTGEYYGKPATVYSLGVLLFTMLCGKFPNCTDRNWINDKIWYKDGLTLECCRLVQDCLQDDPDKRIRLEQIFEHKWFQDKDPADGLQTPVPSEHLNVLQYRDEAGFHIDDDVDVLIFHTSNDQCEEEMEMEMEEMEEKKPGVFIQEINLSQYEIGRQLGEGGFGTVFEGTRLQDGLKVAVKFVRKAPYKIQDHIDVPGYPEPIPREVYLQTLACEGKYVPVLIQFLGWQDLLDHYIMVLERPSPCEDLLSFLSHAGGRLDEQIVRVIMGQAIEAAEVCCIRGVFHRDIKLENFLINPNTLEVKLIDFGCGDLLKSSAYTDFMGTENYFCPEFFLTGEYYGKPATVYSLGVLLFTMLCGKFPNCTDRNWINDKIWYKDGLTLECCRLVQDCLQDDPDKRIRLEQIFEHKWFQDKDPADELQTPVPSEHLNVLQYRDEAGFHINDDVDVLIFHTSNDQCEEEMEMEMEMEEMEEKKPGVFIQEINLSQYEIGRQLGEGGFGTVFEGTRLQDGLKVAVKFVRKAPYKIQDHIDVPGYPEPIPREVYLQTLACEGKYVPVLIQFLGWQDLLDHYVMVLERPSPCEDLLSFLSHAGGRLDEQIVRVIMGQAIEAAEVCCMRGVFHRDIKLENFLINPNTLEVKLIDFGCGDLLKSSAYTDFMGTENYFCPEFFLTGEYYGKPATVYSLGVLLFTMLCGKFPNCTDRNWINDKIWYKDGLTLECCRLVQDCLQDDPDKRIRLEQIFEHKWFQDKDPADELQTPVPSEHLNVLQYRDEAGFHINDDVDVLIFHTSNDQCEEEMEMEMEMEEMEEKKPGVFIQEINLSQYEIGRQLGEGGFGTVFEGTRLQDGLKVAVKFVRKAPYKIQDHIDVPGYPEPIPREVYLQTLACEGKYVPVLIQFLGWQDLLDHYIMVLERPSPCEDLSDFVNRKGGSVTENQALVIMGQAIEAAEVCCMRGVFHRDIKMENFLINPNTLEVKLIDFGCGDLLKSSAYTDFMGTRLYACPEFLKMGKYHGKPATVYSLGVLMFALVCGKFPDRHDRHQLNKKIWNKDGLTKQCCDLIQACMQKNPEERIKLEEILNHKWFEVSELYY